MSKSKGNFVNPHEVVSQYGADALRYFILRELPFGMDGDYRDASMDQRYHSELAGDLGNLIHRALSMIERYFDGVVPDPAAEPAGPLADDAEGLHRDIESHMNELQYSRALERIWEFVRRANQYVEERKPWQLAKNPDERPRLAATMYHLAEAARILGLCITPTMPETGAQIRKQLGLGDPTGTLADEMIWGRLPKGGRVQRGEPLFPRIES